MTLASMTIQLGFWISWMLIPIIYEFLPALYSFFSLNIRDKNRNKFKTVIKLPRISLIIPVYNSESTIFDCIKSVADSSYPNNLINIIVANNQSTDNSFKEYKKARWQYQNLFMQWINTNKGKAYALNSAIYRSKGKYIIHIDSDGILQKNALLNIIRNFENNPTISAQTGTILTDYNMIAKTKHHFLKFVQKNEFFEYAQSFLIGREIETVSDHLFTMSGAFSAFRREKLINTNLYNTQTVGEDIDMTFQIRYKLKGKVVLCPEAIFYVEPLDSLDKLYMQRQRWQRGELETVHYFMNQSNLNFTNFFDNFIVRRLTLDHTILFLRIIWMAAIFILIPLGYSPYLVFVSFLILYILYITICLLNFINIQYYLRFFPKDRTFYLSNYYVLISLPIYYLFCSFIQVIGIINSMTEPAAWKVESFHKELLSIMNIIINDFRRLIKK